MNQKIYLTFQQSELDAVAMYRALTERAQSDAEKETLKQLGAVEGKHAAILRKITGAADLKPTDAMAKPILLLDRLLGRKCTYVLMSIGENAAYFLYQPLAKEHPELQEVAKEESAHGKELRKLVRTLKNEMRDLPIYQLLPLK